MITGYDSESESDDASAVPAVRSPPSQNTVPADAPTASSSSSALATAAAPARAKKVVDYNSLIKGVSKPLNLKLKAATEDDDFAPMLPKSRPGILACLPPPKKAKPNVAIEIPGLIEQPAPSGGATASSAIPAVETVEDEAEQDSDDDGTVAASGCFFNFRPKEDILEEQPIESSLLTDMRAAHQEMATIREEIPETIPEKHVRHDAVPLVAGLSARETQELRDYASTSGLTDVKGENLNDPLWYLKSTDKKTTVTGIMKDVFESQTNKVGDATSMQKRKHQINWLAAEYHEKGAELLEKNGIGKSEQGKTARKYGW